MNIEIRRLEKSNLHEYEELVLSRPQHLLYASVGYYQFLLKILTNIKEHYILAYQDNCLVGALPCIFCENPAHGMVMNSLPFFGSHGGLLLSGERQDEDEIKKALIQAWFQLAEEYKVVSACISTSPLQTDNQIYSDFNQYNYTDERIGQITPLPRYSEKNFSEDLLISIFHPKTRNMVRKSMNHKIVYQESGSDAVLNTLYDLHIQNMAHINGEAKDWNIFKAIQDIFEYQKDYCIYNAKYNDQIIASLLVFYYNKTAEYFVPATRPDFRTLQPMSGLIFHAMIDSIKRGMYWWNWGGTWKSQKGVYQFKKRWGSHDKPYLYYLTIRDPLIFKQTPEIIKKAFPYFYVYPFHSHVG